ncbi:MAG: TolC family protein, partial [Methylomonas sp.]
MSAKLVYALLPVLLNAAHVAADGLPALPDALQDPLQTLPEQRGAVAVLPGDQAPVYCPAEKDFNTPLLLSEAIDIALCNNAQVRAAWANIKGQAATLGLARAAYLPSLKASASPLNSHYQYPGTGLHNVDTNAVTLYGNLTWRLFDFGGRAANMEAANWSMAQALAAQDAQLQKTLNAVIQAYFDAQTASAVVQTKTDAERLAGAILDTATQRENRGVSGRNERLQAATALAKATLGKNRAAGDFHKAVSVLVYALGLAADTPIRLAEADLAQLQTTELSEQRKDLRDWLEDTQKQHPAIIAAMAQVEAARQKIATARAEGLPTLDLVVNAYQNGYPGQGVSLTQTRVETVGVTLTVPIFEGFATTYKIRSAQA